MASKLIITEAFTVAFPHVFKPNVQTRDDGSKSERYEVNMLFSKEKYPEKSDIPGFKAIIAEARKEKFGDEPPKKLRMPIRDGDEEEWDGYPGHWFIRAATTRKPGAVDADTQPILDPEEIYGGCICRAQVNAYGYSAKGNKGIAIGLSNIQKLKDGERLGAQAPKAEDAFTKMGDGGDAGSEFGDDGDDFEL